MKSNIIDLEMELVHETEKAVLVNDGNKKIWLPKEVLEIERTGRKDKETLRQIIIISLPENVALDKGLI